MAAEWHVVVTTPGASVTVARALDYVSGFTPQCQSIAVSKDLKKEIRTSPAFPRYAFGLWEGEDAYLWHRIRRTDDVRGILGGAIPKIVNRLEMDDLINRADPGWIVPGMVPLATAAVLGLGTIVSIQRGIWAGHKGPVINYDDRKMLLSVEISLLGRPIVITVPPVICREAGETGLTTKIAAVGKPSSSPRNRQTTKRWRRFEAQSENRRS